jgi:hypothetical protein
VTLCALLVAYLQRNEPERLKSLVDRLGVDYAFSSTGIDREDLLEALVGTREYSESEGLPFTFLQFSEVTRSAAERAIAWVGV